MRVEHLALPGLVLLHPACSGDEDATFTYFHERQELLAASVDIPNVQAHASRYKPKFTVRGLHFQKPPRAQTKVVRVAHGRIFDVVLDIRTGSPTWGQTVALTLDASDWQRLVIPPGFAHGFCTLEPNTEVEFALSERNERSLLGGVSWDDPDLKVAWPCGQSPGLLLEIDRGWQRLQQLDSPFSWDG